MYQMAVALAQNGCEVFILTDRMPKWVGDYPNPDRLQILLDGHHGAPEDIDVVVTDSKGAYGRKAVEYVSNHPSALFVCFNFETPN